jgi:hypothetical protein
MKTRRIIRASGEETIADIIDKALAVSCSKINKGFVYIKIRGKVRILPLKDTSG